VFSTLPCPGAGLQGLAEVPALEALREFRLRLHGCLASRADALFELADAVACAGGPVTSLVQLCLEPEFRRGHGALYDALSAGRIDDERLFCLLTETLTPLVDGPQARARIAGNDVIDRRMLDRALSGLPAARAAQVRDACARWGRVRVAIDATAYPRPRAECSPGREHVHNGACHCKGSSKTAPGWEYQLAAVTGHLRTAWTAVIDARRTTPATRTAQTIAQARTVVRRLHATGAAGAAAPLLVFDAGYSAAALTDGLSGCPAHILVRLPAGSTFYTDAVAWPGKNGRPAHRGLEVHCLEQEDLEAAAAGQAPRGRKKPLPPNPEPDEELILPDTPLYGTVRAQAWHDVHPQLHGGRGWFEGRDPLPVLRGTLVHVTVSRLPDGRDPHRQLWLWHAGPGPLSLDELWRAYLARFDIEHAIRPSRGPSASPPRRSAPPSRPTAGHASSSPPTPSSCSPAHSPPTCAAPGKSTPTPAGRLPRAASAGGFATSAPASAPPPVSRNPPGPAPAGPREATRDRHPATFFQVKPTCHAPRQRH